MPHNVAQFSSSGSAARVGYNRGVIPSLWPVLQHLANDRPWPPTTAEAADRFVARANQESLLPLLASEKELPPSVVDAIRRSGALVAAHRVRSSMIATALARTAELLDGERYIVLKGCDFANRLYSRFDMRPMADVDILVAEGEMLRVARLLELRGVKRQPAPTIVWHAPSHHEIALSVGDVTLEVHQGFVQKERHRIDYSALFERAMPFEAPGVRALRLADADAFAYETLSIAIKYFASPLIRVVDMWLLLERDPATLERSAARAVEWRAAHAYYATLRFAARVFPEFREARFESVMRNVVSPRLAKFLDERVVPLPARGIRTAPQRPEQLWQKFWLLDDAVRRTAFLAGYARAFAVGALRAAINRRRTVSQN